MIFIHGHKFINKDNRIYTSGSLNESVFLRYKEHFQHVTVFANERTATPADRQKLHEESMVSNVQFSLIKSSRNIFQLFSTAKKIKQAILNHNNIIVRLPSIYGLIAMVYINKLNKTCLVELVGCPWDAYWNHSLKGKLVAPFMWWATRRAVKNAPYALYVTNEFLQKRYPCVGKIIGCSDVSLPMLDNAILEKRIAKIENMINNQPIVIGTSATVNIRYKGQQYIIKAIAKLNKQGYNFEYHLVGGGDNTYLKSIAEKYGVIDKVKFLGLLPHEKVFEYLDSIDIYAQPSKTEGLPRALIEAMSRGCPAIGSDVGGIPELLEEDGIFKSADIDSICEILKSLDKQAMLSMANYNFEKAKEYNKELLEQRRNIFFKEFAKEAGNKSD